MSESASLNTDDAFKSLSTAAVTQFDYSLLERGLTAENGKSEDIRTRGPFWVKRSNYVTNI